MNSIPTHLAHLAISSGFPVPYFVKWIDGKPDFRVMDHAKVVECVDKRLCGICGKRLGEFGFFIGGPVSKETMLFADPAMHESCAKFGILICPFLNKTKPLHSDRPVNCPHHKSASMIPNRPEIMYMIKAKTRTIRRRQVQNEVFITAKMWGFKAFQ
jgi:hypothetical protein